MKLIFSDTRKRFEAVSSYDERHIPKAAGFVADYDNAGKFRGWVTTDPHVAAKLVQYADEPAKAMLADIAQKREQALSASRASDADISVPAPVGLNYLPFQRAGIAYALQRFGVDISQIPCYNNVNGVRKGGDYYANGKVLSKPGIDGASQEEPRTRETEGSAGEGEENHATQGVQRGMESKSLPKDEGGNAQARDPGETPGGLTKSNSGERSQLQGGKWTGTNGVRQNGGGNPRTDGVHPGMFDQNQGTRNNGEPTNNLQGGLRKSINPDSNRTGRTQPQTAFKQNQGCQEGQGSNGFGMESVANPSPLGVLIADSMGLGKTVEALGVINAMPEIKSALVICPASLKINWSREAQKWLTREFQVVIADGKSFPITADFPNNPFAIINYDVLGKHLEVICARKFDLLIADECHMIKNSAAQRSKHVHTIAQSCKYKLMLTGTPIVNRPKELFNIISLLDPNRWDNFFRFAKRYCAAYQESVPTNQGRRLVWNFDGASNLSELQDTLRETIMVRRLKKDVLTELPPKQRQIIEISNGYQEAVERENSEMAKFDAAVEEFEIQAELADAISDKAAYASAVAKLREAERVQFTEMSRLRHETAIIKLPEVIDFCKEALESVTKLVVFGHHHDVINGLMTGMAEYNPVRLMGGDSQEARDKAVQSFQNDPKTRVFVGSIQAAGVGLTLTAASTVVFAELDWVPGNVSQGEDRCHRISQHNSVNVYHVVLDGSLDARLAKTLVSKQAVIDAALDKEHRPPAEPEPEPVSLKKERTVPQLTEEQMNAIHVILKNLAFLDYDHAREINAVGFNKIDTDFGQKLAKVERLSPKQAAAAFRMCRKYKRQIEKGLYEVVYGKEVETK